MGDRANLTVLQMILGDLLSPDISPPEDINLSSDTVLMMEVMEENTHVGHHKQKIVLVLTAMRHFVDTLRRHHRHHGLP